MPKFIIERDVAGAGQMSGDDLQKLTSASCSVLRDMGPKIQWQQSYVTENKLYCIYIAPDEKAIIEHAERGGFPANKISQITTIIDPTTGE
ncbi:MAG: DUF4242 domain-containing protein [Gammaproteobacteria bacterium]|nr:MAG: DUF4242 domain-containing protein [Gammaproteobacteria bacterium]RLA22754.1 MAG: DUF4242 domain-containing protein [Gammaproteobacteria bacterium]